MRLSLRLPQWPTSSLLIVISLSLSATTIFSQPQNLEVFFPSTPPPLVFSPPLNPPTSQSSNNNTKRAIAIAVVVTAVTTLLVVALIFLLISLCRNKRRVRVKQNKFYENVVNNTADRNISEPTTAAAVVHGGVTAVHGGGGIDEFNAVIGSGAYRFGKFEGNLKGLIVDENGLDVVYWRKLEGMSSKNSFKKEVFKKADETDDKQLRLSRKISRRKETVQEIHLLRGKSSTSHIPLSPDSNEIGQFESLEIERQESITIRSPPHPPSPPPPVIISVPKKQYPAPPPLPPVTAVNNAPPQPPHIAKSTMKLPPVPPVKTEDAGASSSSSSSSSSSAVKMKPLQSVKIDNGSYSFDGDMMEALFGYVATNRKSPRTDTTRLVPRKADH